MEAFRQMTLTVAFIFFQIFGAKIHFALPIRFDGILKYPASMMPCTIRFRINFQTRSGQWQIFVEHRLHIVGVRLFQFQQTFATNIPQSWDVGISLQHTGSQLHHLCIVFSWSGPFRDYSIHCVSIRLHLFFLLISLSLSLLGTCSHFESSVLQMGRIINLNSHFSIASPRKLTILWLSPETIETVPFVVFILTHD